VSDFKLYPNPCDGNFKVEMNGEYTLKIVDVCGKILYERIAKDNANLSLDLSSGMYFVCLQNKYGNVSKKFFVK
jgi:hypothetical protein